LHSIYLILNIFNAKGSLYDQLLVSNTKVILPEILNWLAIYEFEQKNYKKAGEYINEGIRLNNNKLALRWDIFNQDNAMKNLIKVE